MYWKLLLAVLLCLGLFGPVAVADVVCTTDTLANYEALGPGGCTIKGLPFMGFSFSTVAVSGGAVPVDANHVTVSPVDPDVQAGLNFASNGFSVTAGQFVQYQLAFSADDPPIIHGWDLLLFDPVTFPAVITITSEECLGAAFLGSVCPTGLTVTNTVFDNGITSVLTDTRFFPASSILGVLTTITLDATNGGLASLNSITEQAVLVPEPSSVLLTASSLLLLFLMRRAR
jgi:hypothetical protein